MWGIIFVPHVVPQAPGFRIGSPTLRPPTSRPSLLRITDANKIPKLWSVSLHKENKWDHFHPSPPSNSRNTWLDHLSWSTLETSVWKHSFCSCRNLSSRKHISTLGWNAGTVDFRVAGITEIRETAHDLQTVQGIRHPRDYHGCRRKTVCYAQDWSFPLFWYLIGNQESLGKSLHVLVSQASAVERRLARVSNLPFLAQERIECTSVFFPGRKACLCPLPHRTRKNVKDYVGSECFQPWDPVHSPPPLGWSSTS